MTHEYKMVKMVKECYFNKIVYKINILQLETIFLKLNIWANTIYDACYLSPAINRALKSLEYAQVWKHLYVSKLF